MNLGGQLLDCGEGFRLNGVSEARGKAHGAQHPQLVFGEAQLGAADGADDFGLQILLSADVVKNLAGHRIEQQAVDGEVAAFDVFLRTLAESHLIGMAAVGVANVAAESGNFDDAAVAEADRESSATSLRGFRVFCRDVARNVSFCIGTSTTPNCAPTA